MVDVNDIPLLEVVAKPATERVLTQLRVDDEASGPAHEADETTADSGTCRPADDSTQRRETSTSDTITSSRWKFSSSRVGNVAACVALPFVVAALVLQYYGIKISEATLREQVWKDCQDREDMKLLEVCQNLSSAPFSNLQLRDIVPHMEETTTYSIACSSSLIRWGRSDHSVPVWKTSIRPSWKSSALLRWAKILFADVFIGLFVVHTIFLWPLRNVRPRTRKTHGSRIGHPCEASADMELMYDLAHRMSAVTSSTTAKTPTQDIAHIEHSRIHGAAATDGAVLLSALCLPILSLPLLYSASIGLRTGRSGDLACGLVLVLLLTGFYVFEPRMQRSRSPLAPKKSIVALSWNIVSLRWLFEKRSLAAD